MKSKSKNLISLRCCTFSHKIRQLNKARSCRTFFFSPPSFVLLPPINNKEKKTPTQILPKFHCFLNNKTVQIKQTNSGTFFFCPHPPLKNKSTKTPKFKIPPLIPPTIIRQTKQSPKLHSQSLFSLYEKDIKFILSLVAAKQKENKGEKKKNQNSH